MGGVDIDDDGESDEFETDRSTGSMRVRGGRPPLPKKKRTINVAKKSVVWEHFTKDVDSPEEDPVAHCNYCGDSYNCHTKNYVTSNMLYHFKTCQKYKSLKAKQYSSQTKFTFLRQGKLRVVVVVRT
jgi:hypothetical protein